MIQPIKSDFSIHLTLLYLFGNIKKMILGVYMENEKIQYVTLLTGACGGLGHAFATELTKNGTPILICGTSETKLTALKDELSTINKDLKIFSFVLDLSNQQNIANLATFLTQHNLQVNRLINNAGFITEGSIKNAPIDTLLQTIKVNCEGTISLTKLILDQKKSDEELKIITIASLAANYPMPYMAIYASTKSLLKNFMLSLRYEYRKDNVKVTIVTPSAIATSQAMKDAISAQGFKGKISCVSPEKIARKSLIKNEHNRAVFIPGGFNKFVNFISCLTPRALKIHFIGSSWKKSQNKRNID